MNKAIKYIIIIVAVAAIAYAAYTLWQNKQKNAPVSLKQAAPEETAPDYAGGYDNGMGAFANNFS